MEAPAFTDVGSMIFEVADTFDMELVRDPRKTVGGLTSRETRRIVLMENLNWKISPTVIDSCVYETARKVGAVLHVCGSLYLCMLVDGQRWPADSDKSVSQMWVLDGAKLGWAARTSAQKILVFPSTGWDRRALYKALIAGVVASYTRKTFSAPWCEVSRPREQMLSYIEAKGSVPAEKRLAWDWV